MEDAKIYMSMVFLEFILHNFQPQEIKFPTAGLESMPGFFLFIDGKYANGS